VIVAHFGLMATPWIGALVVLGALGLTTVARWLEHKDGNMPISGAGGAVAAH
jgi:DHA1 family inner membrane transport protein